MGADADAADASLAAEALRLNTRYVEEIVLAWGLCPWAERSFRHGHVRQHVIVDVAPTPEAALPFVDELVAAPDLEIGLLIFPRAPQTAPQWDAFAEKVRRADHARRPDAATSPPAPAFLIAAFHPDARATFDTAAQMVSFVRRTPDPTLQLVRTSILKRATGEGGRVSDDITQRNFEAVRERGADALDAAVRELRRDRDQTYARLYDLGGSW
ncbi:MAG TPA: DUF1415 family protein [Polyangia bacterium]|nr:DUF1415 family protein [Polyangia bacterium]